MRERAVNWDYCVIKIDLLGIVVDAMLWVEGTKHILLERRKSAVEDGTKTEGSSAPYSEAVLAL